VELYIHSPNTPSWRCAPLKNHRDNFTFALLYFTLQRWYSSLKSLLSLVVANLYCIRAVPGSSHGRDIYHYGVFSWSS
jgi:hypothetical protein